MADNDKRDDGGPAFPQHDLSAYGMGPAMRGHVPGDDLSGKYEVEGMSLRDWFAGQLIGHLATDVSVGRRLADQSHDAVARSIAGTAYLLADAMIAERRK